MTVTGKATAREDAVARLRTIVLGSSRFEHLAVVYHNGETVLEEGAANDAVLVILAGAVNLTRSTDGATINIDRIEPGHLLGIVSFTTGEPSFTSGVAIGSVEALRLRREDIRQLGFELPDAGEIVQRLIFDNLADRYRRLVDLSLELERERSRLKRANADLTATRDRLIHQEKMAILGQLVSGVAHEINNPTAALLRSAEGLSDRIGRDLAGDGVPADQADRVLLRRLFDNGSSHAPLPTAETRRRMTSLADRFPGTERAALRILAAIDTPLLDEIARRIVSLRNQEAAAALVDTYTGAFEHGRLIRSIRVAGGTIERLVHSLRGYARSDTSTAEPADLIEGIHDTLLVLSHRLRGIEVELDFRDLPAVRCRLGEINQVWTNLIVNAVEAMRGNSETGGALMISAAEGRLDEQPAVIVTICDNGPGIDVAVRDRLFEPNVTTKNASGSFGLGLGLAIAREIVFEHGGRIDVGDNAGHGACFNVTLPADPPTGDDSPRPDQF